MGFEWNRNIGQFGFTFEPNDRNSVKFWHMADVKINFSRPVHYIDNNADLEKLWEELDSTTWLGYDTEFIGEKRDIALLCVLQIVTENAIWLVDTLSANDWIKFGNYISKPDILKITHAGENDYRLLFQLIGVLPENIFDLQVAAGFCGFKYPASLSTILYELLGIQALKGFTVADWSIRPLPEKMRQYAIDDVRWLPDMYVNIQEKLELSGRTDWVVDEMAKWKSSEFYTPDPLKKLLHQKSIAAFGEQEKLFMLRIAKWRQEVANKSGERAEDILSNRQIVEMARIVASGIEAMFRSRILPKQFIRQYKESIIAWYGNAATTEELGELYEYAPRKVIDQEDEVRVALVFQLLQGYCVEQKLAIDLLIPSGEAKKYRIIPGYHYDKLETGWRKGFLPDIWQKMLANRNSLHFSVVEKGVLVSYD